MPEPAVCTVLGSGFGLYGYVPAAMEIGWQVALPVRYRSKMEQRPELSQFVGRVIWCADEEEALARSNNAIVALRPSEQALRIPRLVRMTNLQSLIIEKPVAPSPPQAASLLSILDASGKNYRVGYTFRLTPWANQLRSMSLNADGNISIQWKFQAHHYRFGLENWKRFDSTGGGAVRFYGIHLIALLSELGYTEVVTSIVSRHSDDETACWEATLSGQDRCPISLIIDTNHSASNFHIARNENNATQILVDQPDPFSHLAGAGSDGQDQRVGLLEKLCCSLSETDQGHGSRQKKIIDLWSLIETRSERVSLHRLRSRSR